MGLFRSFVNQTRKPKGVLGKMMLGSMNGSGHAKMADWGMSHLDGIKPSLIAELGCGGGRNDKSRFAGVILLIQGIELPFSADERQNSLLIKLTAV